MHGLLGTTLKDVLQQVATFTSAHPKEIIILDFNHIYVKDGGKTNFITATDAILQELTNAFKTRLCSLHQTFRARSYRIKDIWKMKCQVIPFLTEELNKRSSIAIKSPFSYTKFTQKSPWLHFLDVNYQKEREANTFYVTQGIMQPHWMEVVVAGLSEKATLKEWVSKEATNDIVEWLRDKRIGENGVNIVIADFVEFHNFTEKVVELNFSSSSSLVLHFFGRVDRLLSMLVLAVFLPIFV